MSKNKQNQNRINSVLYQPRTLFNLHTYDNFDKKKFPLASLNNLDLAEEFAQERIKQKKTGDFYRNAGAVKITADHLSKPIKYADISEKLKNETGKYPNLGHSERRVMMKGLSEFIPEGEYTPPIKDYSSSQPVEQELEKFKNLFEKAGNYKNLLESKQANVGLWTERPPCNYGNNYCEDFINRILPDGSNVGHILPPSSQPYEDAASQATRLSRFYDQLQAGYNEYNNQGNISSYSLPKMSKKPLASILASPVNSSIVKNWTPKGDQASSTKNYMPDSNPYRVMNVDSPLVQTWDNYYNNTPEYYTPRSILTQFNETPTSPYNAPWNDNPISPNAQVSQSPSTSNDNYLNIFGNWSPISPISPVPQTPRNNNSAIPIPFPKFQ